MSSLHIEDFNDSEPFEYCNTHQVHGRCALLGNQEPLLFSALNLVEDLFLRTRLILSSLPGDNILKRELFSRIAERNFDGLKLFNEKKYFYFARRINMKKTKKMSLFLLIGSVLSSLGLGASENEQKTYTDSVLLDVIDTEVLKTITCSTEIPGLDRKEFSTLKAGILKTWVTLYKEGVLEVSGRDKDVRPYFVAIQGIVEHVLASELQNNVKILDGVIHTPMPAMPLCCKGEITKDLVGSSIELDPHRLFTVKARATILRDYLSKGGYLYSVYPRGGFEKRTEEQQIIYKQELLKYPNLFDIPLNCESIPDEFIGATYLFQDLSGNKFIFAIKMTQAKDPQDIGNFGLWLGRVHDPAIQEHLRKISHYLERNGVNILAQ